MSWEWNKIFQRIWGDENVRTLPADHLIIVIYLLVNTEVNRIGLYRLSVAMASENLRVSQKVFHKRLLAVCAALHWKWDPKASVLFIPTWFKYYPIAEGATKNLIGYMTDLRLLPKTFLVEHFKCNQAFIPPAMKELFLQHFHKHIGIPYPIPHRRGIASKTETETETETEIEREMAAAPPDPLSSSSEVGNKTASLSEDHNNFKLYWDAYPFKIGKRKAYKAWKETANTRPHIDVILAAIAKQKGWLAWKENLKGQSFIPSPAKWLSEGRWDDEQKIAKRVGVN